MPPTFILSQDQTLQLMYASNRSRRSKEPFEFEREDGRINPAPALTVLCWQKNSRTTSRSRRFQIYKRSLTKLSKSNLGCPMDGPRVPLLPRGASAEQKTQPPCILRRAQLRSVNFTYRRAAVNDPTEKNPAPFDGFCAASARTLCRHGTCGTPFTPNGRLQSPPPAATGTKALLPPGANPCLKPLSPEAFAAFPLSAKLPACIAEESGELRRSKRMTARKSSRPHGGFLL